MKEFIINYIRYILIAVSIITLAAYGIKRRRKKISPLLYQVATQVFMLGIVFWLFYLFLIYPWAKPF